MMKTMSLLAFVASCVFSAPYDERQLLTNIFNELNTLKHFPEDAMADIFLNNLKVKDHRACKHDFFCNAEKQLKDKVSGRSGAQFEPFRIDKALIRNLFLLNSKHQKDCKPANNQNEIQLKEFLEDLIQCVRAEISRKRI